MGEDYFGLILVGEKCIRTTAIRTKVEAPREMQISFMSLEHNCFFFFFRHRAVVMYVCEVWLDMNESKHIPAHFIALETTHVGEVKQGIHSALMCQIIATFLKIE
jgi:hypothetical protein